MGRISLIVHVCVFSSHSFWASSSLDVPAGVTQEEGHKGFFIQVPSAVGCCVVFFTLTDRASTIPSIIRGGCQSGTWSAGQKEIRGTSTKLQ